MTFVTLPSKRGKQGNKTTFKKGVKKPTTPDIDIKLFKKPFPPNPFWEKSICNRQGTSCLVYNEARNHDIVEHIRKTIRTQIMANEHTNDIGGTWYTMINLYKAKLAKHEITLPTGGVMHFPEDKSQKCYFINPMSFRTFPNKLKIKQEVAEHSDVLIDRKNYWPNKIIGA